MTSSPKRARIEQKKKALQLLTLSGAIRSADIEARYRGSDTVLGVAGSPQQELSRDRNSIWWMNLSDLFRALQARQSASRSTRKILTTNPASQLSMAKRSTAPRAA